MKFPILFLLYLLIQNENQTLISSNAAPLTSPTPNLAPKTAIIANRELKQRQSSFSNKIKKNSKHRNLSNKSTQITPLQLKQITLPKLLGLIKITDPQFYTQMAPLSKEHKIRFLQQQGGGFFKTHGKLLLALGGALGVKLIMDRIIQTWELDNLQELIHFKTRTLIQSRIQKRRELSDLEASIISLEDKLENLTEGTGSKVTELNGWIDSHRF